LKHKQRIRSTIKMMKTLQTAVIANKLLYW
jgi:hypothetical protein